MMYLKKIRFINTISLHIKYMTDEHIANTESITLNNSIKQFNRIYMQRSF